MRYDRAVQKDIEDSIKINHLVQEDVTMANAYVSGIRPHQVPLRTSGLPECLGRQDLAVNETKVKTRQVGLHVRDG